MIGREDGGGSDFNEDILRILKNKGKACRPPTTVHSLVFGEMFTKCLQSNGMMVPDFWKFQIRYQMILHHLDGCFFLCSFHTFFGMHHTLKSP